MLETQLHLVNGVVALLAAAIPIYLTVKLNNNLRQLTAILSIFILVHAVYSWLGFFGFDFLSDGVFQPLSAAVLMLFGIFYYWIAKQTKVSIKMMVIIWSRIPVLFIFLGTIILLLATLSIFVWLAARSKNGDIGLEINVVAVAFLSIMIWLRFYYSQSSGKRTIEAQ